MTKEELIAFEDKVASLWEAGKIKYPVHLSGGNEDMLIEMFKHIRKEDYVFSTHRNHYHYLLHGGDADKLLAELVGEPGSLCRGKAGSMGIIDVSRNFFANGILGGNCAIAVGVAWAIKESKGSQRVMCFVGDGCTDEGHFWEAVRYAQAWRLPVKFVIEDNNRSVTTDCETRWNDKTIESFASGFLDDNLFYYKFEPTKPHVGTGVHVNF
jgi:TPP-dependent pyruvate/acetoin dehydrogenase alpha subunit